MIKELLNYVQALLTNGPEPGEADICQDTWTLAEAVQAIVILASLTALGFGVYGWIEIRHRPASGV